MFNDYRVNLKIRNANLLRAIEESGGVSGKIFCEKIGISYPTLFRYVNLITSPLYESGELKPCALKLCEYLNKLPEELWSLEQLTPIEKNNFEAEVSFSQMQQLTASSNPLRSLEREQAIDVFDNVISTLTSREQKVLNLRFGIDGEKLTLDEIAKKFDVTRERIKQIENKALRKLRNPNSGLKNVYESYLECM